MRRALQYQRLCGGTIALHEEDPELSGGGVMHEGPVSAALGLAGIPSVSESTMIARDAALAAYEGARIHVQHLSAAESVEVVRAARAAGVQISAEASPHHLCLTDEEVRSLDPHRFKMNPPLRRESDRQALIEGLRDGTIECIATDHAPHQAEEKDVPFEQAAMGVTGLETAFAALHTELVLPGVIDLALLVERLAGGAAPFGIERPSLAPGSEANVVLCDLGAEWTVGEDGYESRSLELLVRRPHPDRPGPGHRRRRPGRLPPAQLQPGSRRVSAEASPSAYLLLEDGTRLDGDACGAPRPDHRRGRLQHGDDRLPGVGHRPLLRRPDHRLHLPPDRQLRRLRGGDGVRTRPTPAASSCATPRTARTSPAPRAAGSTGSAIAACRGSAASTPAPWSATSATAARCAAASSRARRPEARGARGDRRRALDGRRRLRPPR